VEALGVDVGVHALEEAGIKGAGPPIGDETAVGAGFMVFM